ncbi:SAMP protein, partial [Atractosteus spatula]|nr:SAMP protein [Atractosteus spatula]
VFSLDLTGRAFYFPKASDPLYVRLIPERHEALTETTVCLRYSSDQNANMFLFSISTPHEDNVLTLYKVHQGEYATSLNNVQTTFKVNDTAPPSGWTHICVTWESATGSVRLFVNGMHSRYQKGSLRKISHGMQSIYLGQDPASTSGKTGSHYSFSGQITEVYVGDTVLSDCEISALNAGLDAPFDSLLSWKSLQYEKHDKILLKHVKGICL